MAESSTHEHFQTARALDLFRDLLHHNILTDMLLQKVDFAHKVTFSTFARQTTSLLLHLFN